MSPGKVHSHRKRSNCEELLLSEHLRVDHDTVPDTYASLRKPSPLHPQPLASSPSTSDSKDHGYTNRGRNRGSDSGVRGVEDSFVLALCGLTRDSVYFHGLAMAGNVTSEILPFSPPGAACLYSLEIRSGRNPAVPLEPLDVVFGYPCAFTLYDRRYLHLGTIASYLSLGFVLATTTAGLVTLVVRYRQQRNGLLSVIRREGGLYLVSSLILKVFLAVHATPHTNLADDYQVLWGLTWILGNIFALRMLLLLRKIDDPGTRAVISSIAFDVTVEEDQESTAFDSDTASGENCGDSESAGGVASEVEATEKPILNSTSMARDQTFPEIAEIRAAHTPSPDHSHQPPFLPSSIVYVRHSSSSTHPRLLNSPVYGSETLWDRETGLRDKLRATRGWASSDQSSIKSRSEGERVYADTVHFSSRLSPLLPFYCTSKHSAMLSVGSSFISVERPHRRHQVQIRDLCCNLQQRTRCWLNQLFWFQISGSGCTVLRPIGSLERSYSAIRGRLFLYVLHLRYSSLEVLSSPLSKFRQSWIFMPCIVPASPRGSSSGTLPYLLTAPQDSSTCPYEWPWRWCSSSPPLVSGLEGYRKAFLIEQ
ncbi:hypothetical protein NMY22_g11133 [Coprinellus aureogranulatus]|nr:hypothetical protein NMY22_g11133 [Coprinellus aureogranulatus]